MSSFQINISQLKNDIAKYVAQRGLPIILEEAVVIATPKLITEFIRAFRRTLVGKALRGAYEGDPERDVVAHLGLTPDMQRNAMRQIESALKTSLDITDIRGRVGGRFASLKDATSIGFNISVIKLEENLLREVDGEYLSKGGEVPWLDWLLNGGEVRDFRIVFNTHPDISKVSRSERALMFPSKQYDWDTEDFNNFSESGRNFMTDMLEDEKWVERSFNIISTSAKSVLQSRNITI